jgi:ribonuclease VapC
VTIVVDASAIVALGMNEPERLAIEAVIGETDDLRAASINLTEAGIALVLRYGRFTEVDYDAWLRELNIKETPIEARAALKAYLQYGKGVHRAGLNLGDCFAYALAKQLDAPLLYKGEDFIFTDVKRALQPT